MGGSGTGVKSKICVACGVDCADLPRTKDTKGRYYCKPCFDDLLARKQRGEQISIPPAGVNGSAHKNGAPPPPPAAPDPFAALALMDDSPLADPSLLDGLDAGAPPQTVPCPTCRAPLTPGAVICVNCGTDPRSGAAVQTAVVRAPRQRGDGSTAWVVPIGVIAIIAGGAGTLLFLASVLMVGLALMAANPIAGLVAIALLLAVALIPLYHLLGGIGLLRRDRFAIDRIRTTSAIFIIVQVIATAIQIAALKVGGEAARDAREMNPDMAELPTDMVVPFMLLGLVIACAWPAFAFVFLGSSSVRKATRDW